MKLLNWNLEWRSARSRHASVIRRELERDDLEVVCLTETLTDWLTLDGEWIEAEADYGYGPKATRRKVALWARDGFSSVTNASVEGMPPGRFVSGVTKGGVRVVGVCIPWRDAHVSTGRRDRKPWEEHVEYLAALGRYLRAVGGGEVRAGAGGGEGEESVVKALDAADRNPPLLRPAGGERSASDSRVCVVGDFNQTLPRSRAPKQVYDAMMTAFAGLEVLTAGREADSSMRLIDHVAASPGSRLESWEQLPIVSDHVGWVGDVRFG